MKSKSILISVVLSLAVFLSACAPAALQGMSASQAGPRTLTISGAGKVTLKPDIAYIYIGVHTEKSSAAEAVAENNAKTQQLIDALKAAGVDAKDIKTSNFSIWQNTPYGPDGRPISTNYAVDNTVYLTVRALDLLGDLLDAAVKAGATNVNSIQFDVADKTQALSDARVEAVKNAKKQADELASAAGVSLGTIQNIQYSDSGSIPVLMDKGMGGGGAMVANANVPINPGQIEVAVNVTLTFEIK